MARVVRGNTGNGSNKRPTRKAKKRGLTKKEKLIAIFSVILIIACLVAVGAMFLMNYSFLKDSSGGDDGIIDQEIKTPDEIKQDVTTILIVGIADDENEREASNLTDVLMIVSVDKTGNCVNIFQIPRDSYVGNESANKKINAVYKNSAEKWDYAGISGLTNIIYEMFQLTIDHYVTMKMDGFESIVDEIGGVTMDVPVEMPLQNGEGLLQPGVQTLYGDEAITVVRARYAHPNGDFGRMETQRKFMAAFLQKCLQLGTTGMAKMLPSIFKYVTTDMTAMEALSFYKLVQGMDMNNIKGVTAPCGGTMVDSQYVLSIYPERTARILNENFRPYTDDVPTEQLQIRTALTEPEIAEDEDFGLQSFSEFNSTTE